MRRIVLIAVAALAAFIAMASSASATVRADDNGTPSSQSGPCYFFGGAWLGVTCWNSPKPLTFFVEYYTVPKNPSVKEKSYFALWGGLQDAGGDAVLQNILAWNENNWAAYPEYYWDGGTSHAHNKNWPSIPARAGDTIVSLMEGTDCTNSGHCTWNLVVDDERTHQMSSSGNIRTTNAFTQLLGGVFEPHSTLNKCTYLPASGSVAFTDLSVANNEGANVTPKFGNSIPHRDCGMVAKSTSTSTHFIWKT
jgi:hypothetical protein